MRAARISAWLTAGVLALAAAGCFRSHGREPLGDAGRPPPDAARPDATFFPPDVPGSDGGPSECGIDPGVIVGLECPESVPRGAAVTVSVRAHMLGCCAVSAPAGTTARALGPDAWAIEAPYSACRCCEMCLCEEVVTTRSVTLEPPAGASVRIVAGELACEVRVEDVACRTLRADAWMAPRHVAIGEPIPVRVVHEGGVSCGCSPRTELGTRTGPELSFLACGCSDLDPCVDPGYEATALAVGPSAPAQVQFYHPYPGGRVIVDVHERASCVDDPTLIVDALAQVAPDPRLIAEDPGATWIELRGHHARCCGEPAVLVEDETLGGSDHVLTLRDCAPDPCDCAIPHRVDFVEHHYLGSLPSGTTNVSAGSGTISITVP